MWPCKRIVDGSAVGGVDDADCRVAAAGGDLLAIGRIGHGEHVLTVRDLEANVAGVGVADRDLAGPVAGGERLAVGRIGDGIDRAGGLVRCLR